MSAIPSKWATCPVSYGEGKRHLVIDDHEGFILHATEEKARAHAKAELRGGDGMVALMRVEALLKVKQINIEELK